MAESKQDAIALLKADHRKVEDLFEKFENAKGDGAKRKIALQICTELTVHTAIEEEIFYPACKGKIEEDLIKEAYVEHDGAKLLMAEIEAGGPDDEYYDAKVKVLQEQIEHHVKEEEQMLKGMFSQARRAGLDMDALGEQLADLLGLRGLVTVEGTQVCLERRGGGQRVALAVVDDLHEDVAGRAVHDEARTRLGADDALAQPGVPARALRGLADGSHYFPLFPALRRTTSPA